MFNNGNSPLQLVMSGLVEEIAESNHAHSLTGKVQRQPGRTAADQTRDWVQFLSAVSKIVASHNEVGGAEGGIRRKQDAVVTIPESVIRGSFGNCRARCADLTIGTGSIAPGSIARFQQRERDLLLRQSRPAETQDCQQNGRFRRLNLAKPACPHHFSEPPVLAVCTSTNACAGPSDMAPECH